MFFLAFHVSGIIIDIPLLFNAIMNARRLLIAADGRTHVPPVMRLLLNISIICLIRRKILPTFTECKKYNNIPFIIQYVRDVNFHFLLAHLLR